MRDLIEVKGLNGSVTRRQLALAVYLPTFFLAFATGVMTPIMPLYARRFEESVALIGVAVAALAFGTMLADVPAGMLLDRTGRRPMMLAGTAMVAICAVGLAQAHVFPELIIYRLVGGVGSACWGISRLAFMTDAVPPEQRGRALSTFGGLQRVGSFTGPVAGGVVGQVFDLRVSFALAAALAVTATVLSFMFVPETRPARTGSSKERWQILGEVLRTNWKDFTGASAAQIFAQMIRSGRQLIIPLYGDQVLGLSPSQIGSILSLSAIIDASLFIPAGMLMDRLGRKFASIPSFSVMALGMAMVPFAGGFFTLLLATSVIGLGNGLGAGTMMTLGADLSPKAAAGEFLGLWRVVGDAGQMSGPLTVGAIAGLVGFTATAFVLSGVGILTAGIIYFAVQETLQRPGTTADELTPSATSR